MMEGCMSGHVPDVRTTPTTKTGNTRRCSRAGCTSPAEVTILNPVPYAAIHNEGGTITSHPTITPKMRKMAWAKVYAIAGVKKGKGKKKGKLPKQLPAEALKWKALALTKKTKLTVKATIPKRQFMGNSAELSAKVRELINQSIQNVRQQLSRFT